MIKHIIMVISVATFILLYFLTNSWEIAAIGFVILFGNIFELGLFNIQENKDQFEKDFKSMKKKHIKNTENNSTLR